MSLVISYLFKCLLDIHTLYCCYDDDKTWRGVVWGGKKRKKRKNYTVVIPMPLDNVGQAR